VTYASGRTQEPFIMRSVVEEGTLYVPPDLFDVMQRTIVENLTMSAADAAHEALRRVGVPNEWILRRKFKGFTVVVDYELPGIGQ
jgi:hypothetical protein